MTATVTTAWQAPRDVADMLAIDVEQVLAWIAAGELQAVNVAKTPRGKRPRWRISQAALDQFLDARKKQSTTGRATPRRRTRSAAVTQYF